ncbi:hypothetical protein [Polaromonas sp.]|uniref:hypothetical protein n=1 Tax=Polaromonas sp. TaxID=1869339 RepID=UPI003CA5E563
MLIKLSLAVAVVGGLWYAGRRIAGALPDFSGWELPSRLTPVEMQAAYQENLTEARNDPAPASLGSLFVYSPFNYDLADLVPPGMRVNQWGGLEPIPTTTAAWTGGATGSW